MFLNRLTALLLPLLLGAGVLYFCVATLFAQEQTDTYLPVVAGGATDDATQATPMTPSTTGNETATVVTTAAATMTATDSPTSAATVSPTSTQSPNQQFNAAWNPPATATPTATPVRTYPNWIGGTYNVRQRSSEAWAEFGADGSVNIRQANIGSADVLTEVGTWYVVDRGGVNQMFWETTNQDNETRIQHFILEEVDDGFRLAAGNFRLSALLYERTSSTTAFDGEYQSRWMIGSWEATTFDGTYTFDFKADGRYEIFNKESFFDDDVTFVEEGQWNLWADRLVMQRTNDSQAESHHTVVSATDSFIDLQGGRYDDFSLFRLTLEPPATLANLEGQYYDDFDDNTVTLVKNGDSSYAATIWHDGQETSVAGAINESGRLDLVTGIENTEYTNLHPTYNGLIEEDFGLDNYLIKRSETALPEPENLHGLWYYYFSNLDSSGELWFLPDGRYVSKSGGPQEEGTFTDDGAIITFDPDCGAPVERTYDSVGNQLAFPDTLATVTYHHVPFMTADLVASITARDEREAQTSFDFANNTASLAAIDPAFVSPASGELSVDVNRDDQFADAVTFEAQQLYTWPQELVYYLDNNGSLVQIHQTYCAINSCAHLDLTQSWQDKFHYWFFPNGRVQYYNESYGNATSTTPVTPTITRVWGKYKIEDEQITIETDMGETLAFEFTLGRRRAVHGEICYENIEWSTTDDGR